MRNPRQLIVAATAIPFLFLAAPPRLAAQQRAEPVWSSIGPDGGDLVALAQAPGEPQDLYAVTEGGGVWRSESGGRQWALVGRGLAKYPVTALAVDRADAEVVYAVAFSKGVLKSADGGSSWSAASQGLPASATSGFLELAADPYHPGRLYAGTADGVYKSLDGAASWKPANDGLAGEQIYALALTPAALFAGFDRGVAKSVNGGVSWQFSRLGLGESIHTLAADPSRPAVLYGASVDHLWKSADGGGSWSSAGFFADVISLLATDAGGAVYVGTPFTLFRSTDEAASFRALPPAPFVSFPGSPGTLLADRSAPGTLLAAISAGLFRTLNGGISWQPLNHGLRGLSVVSLAVDPRDASAVYAGVTTGFLVGRHREAAWTPRFAALGLIQHVVEVPYFLAVDPAGSGTIYRSLLFGLSRSFDGGRRWHDLKLPDSCLEVFALALDPSSPRTVYAGGDAADAGCFDNPHAYKSTDAGNTWTTLSIGGVDGFYVDPSSPETVYAVADPLMKSTDGGMTWSSAGAGLPQVIYSLAIDPQSSSTLYAATRTGFFKSTDGGGAWRPAGAGLPPGAVSTVVVSPREPGTVYAGIQGVGVFRSMDGAASWSALSAGLPRRVFTGLVVIAPSDPSILYAATAGNSIYELQLH